MRKPTPIDWHRLKIVKFLRHRARQADRLLAGIHRQLALRTTVIAITGSVGKSTAKECLAAILAEHGRTLKTLHNQNDQTGVPRALRALRPGHRHAVIEMGTAEPGRIERSARLVRPDIAIVLCIARTHTDAFPTLDDTAAEKAALLDHLRRGGVAILNGDDPRVRRMAERCRTRVVFFGRTGDCDLVAEDVRSAWPQRLQFTLRSGSERYEVRTRLVGTHWLNSALAALAAARVCGIPLAQAAAALGRVPPFAGRMQPVALPGGAIVIRDEENGSIDTLEAMVAVMREARATRRVLVFGDVSDLRGRPKNRQKQVGRIAAEVADLALFVGEHAHHAQRSAIRAGLDPARCLVAETPERAAILLKECLREGDLVFVKGRSSSHLERVVFAQFGEIGCWRSVCRLRPLCELCDELRPAFDLQRTLDASVPH